MYYPPVPVIDRENPLYCPAIPASKYLKTIREKHQRRRREQPGSTAAHGDVQSFAESLLDAQSCSSDAPVLRRSRCRRPTLHSSSPSRDSWIAPWDNEPSVLCSRYPLLLGSTKHTARRRRMAKQSYRHFAINFGPSQHAKSDVSLDEKSFEVMLTRKRLQYPALDRIQESSPGIAGPIELDLPLPDAAVMEIDSLRSRLQALEEKHYGTVTADNFKDVVLRVDRLLPGIRMKERLTSLSNQSPQGIIDYLANAGLLNPRILSLFSKAKVHSIYLAPSIRQEDGLNLNPLLQVFSKPDVFKYLHELSFANALIQDYDLKHIHHLPNLSSLSLHNTGISNAAVFLVASLKESLTELSIANNPAIDDEAVPALLVLSRLSYLSILDTGIGMHGLRRYAKVVHEEERCVDVEIPVVCDVYIENVHKYYLYNPLPPLVTDPTICSSLSTAALQRNLEAHQRANQQIVSKGTKDEMRERLEGILKAREGDVIVRDMLGLDGESEEADIVE